MEAGDPAEHHRDLLHLAGEGSEGERAKKYDPAVASNPLIFPTAKMLDSVHIFDSKALNNQKYVSPVAGPGLGLRA